MTEAIKNFKQQHPEAKTYKKKKKHNQSRKIYG